MVLPKATPETDTLKRLKGLMLFRVLFAFMLLASTAVFRMSKSSPFSEEPHYLLFGISIGILLLSSFYFIVWRFIDHTRYFIYGQLIVDSVIITLIVYVTGCYISVFNFLYLIVILCAGMLLFRSGSLAIATLCSLQYSVMIALEYNRVISPYGMASAMFTGQTGPVSVVYKVLAIVVAGYAIAYLGSLLAEQEKETKYELIALAKHVKRVEQTAAMGEMAAGLAHEIKNPLASLSGSIQLLREEIRYNPDHDKLMQIILREAGRLSTLVNNFLLFARPDIGNKKTFKLHEVLEEVILLFEKDVPVQKKIQVFKTIESDLWIEMDPAHLKQVLWNLLLNAGEAVDENGRIAIRAYSSKSTHVCIEVEDNGCGMSEDTRELIFNPFYTTRQNGTGLGLSIVQRILAYYDCFLDVRSEVGKGSKFILKLKQVIPL